MRTVRAFIAIRLSPEVLAAVTRVQACLRQGEGGLAARWIAQESIHLTLKFLGDVPVDRLPAVNAATARAVAPFGALALRLSDPGCFPNLRRPRIVWLGLREPSGALMRLQAVLERELEHEGFPREERAFTPHLTIGRVQPSARPGELQALAAAVESYRLEEDVAMRADALYVLQSDLRPSGAVYTELFTASLRAGAA
ncbi:MAG: RNA 2',3'-cyclic phosphodiesterase [Anaerolineae bacterium]